MRPSEMQPADHIVAIKTVLLPSSQPWISRFAEHSWLEVKDQRGWSRVEVLSRSSGVRVRSIEADLAVKDERWGQSVHVIECVYGEAARRAGEQVIREAGDYPWAEQYEAWPGPNSNTFAEWMIRRVPELAAELYPNAVGVDYTPIVHAGFTSTGTGIEVETWPLGFEVGLCEGVEVHLLGLTIGVGLWPPSLKLPFLPAIPSGF